MLYDFEVMAAIALVVVGVVLITRVWWTRKQGSKSEKIHFAAPPADDAAPPKF